MCCPFAASAGLAAGLCTCLVLSGCHSIEDGQHYPEVPHFFAKSVSSLHPPLPPVESDSFLTPRQPHLRRPRLPSLDLELGSVPDSPPKTDGGSPELGLQSWILARSNLLFSSPSYTQSSTPPLRQCLEGCLASGGAHYPTSGRIRSHGVDTE